MTDLGAGTQMNQLVVVPRPATNPSQVIVTGTSNILLAGNRDAPAANLVQPGTTAFSPPQSVPEPAAPRQSLTGTHQPVQQYLTTHGVISAASHSK